jgi:hypothetical protein
LSFLILALRGFGPSLQDSISCKTMTALLYDMLNKNYDNYSEKELIAEIEEYYPHILEESDTN